MDTDQDDQFWMATMIKFVKGNPILWDEGHKDHHKRTVLDKQWSLVTTKINAELEEDIEVKTVRENWKKIRDAWTKNQQAKASGVGVRKSKNTRYFGKMDFLHKTLKVDNKSICKKQRKPLSKKYQSASPLSFTDQPLTQEQIDQSRRELMDGFHNLEALQESLQKKLDEKVEMRTNAGTDREKYNAACQASRIRKGKLGQLMTKKDLLVAELKRLYWMEQALATMKSEPAHVLTAGEVDRTDPVHMLTAAGVGHADPVRVLTAADVDQGLAELEPVRSGEKYQEPFPYQSTIDERRHQLINEQQHLGTALAVLYERSEEINARTFLNMGSQSEETLEMEKKVVASQIETATERIEGKKKDLRIHDLEGRVCEVEAENQYLREKLADQDQQSFQAIDPEPTIPAEVGKFVESGSGTGETIDMGYAVGSIDDAAGSPRFSNLINAALNDESGDLSGMFFE